MAGKEHIGSFIYTDKNNQEYLIYFDTIFIEDRFFKFNIEEICIIIDNEPGPLYGLPEDELDSVIGKIYDTVNPPEKDENILDVISSMKG